MSSHNNSVERIGLNTAISIGIKSMIGAGIFSITSLLGAKTGPAGILSFLFAFTAIWFIAQSFARVAYLYPQEGSFYLYAKKAGGHVLGLITAGAYILGLLIAMGLLCKIAGQYLHNMCESCSAYGSGLVIIALFMILNIFGAKISSIGIYILLSLTLYALIATTMLCLSNANVANLFPFMPNGVGSILGGAKIAVFGLFGFESIASLFGIVKNPEQNVPKALRYTILIVGGIYFTFIASILLGIPQETFILHPNSTIPQILTHVFPQFTYINQTIGFCILFAILGTIHAVIWASSQLMFTYFKNLNIAWLTNKINAGTVTSKTCVLTCGIIILYSYQTINNFGIFFSLTNICLLFAYIISILPLLYLKQEWKSGQNYFTIIGLFLACAIFIEAAHTFLKAILH